MQTQQTPKNADYHEAAIQYNNEFAEFAAGLSRRLEDKNKEVARWCMSISRQHEFHSNKHQKALNRLRSREEGAVEDTEDGSEGNALDVDSSKTAEQNEVTNNA